MWNQLCIIQIIQILLHLCNRGIIGEVSSVWSISSVWVPIEHMAVLSGNAWPSVWIGRPADMLEQNLTEFELVRDYFVWHTIYHRMKNDQSDSGHFQKLAVTLLVAEPKGLVVLQAFCFKLKNFTRPKPIKLKSFGSLQGIIHCWCSSTAETGETTL